MRTISKTILTLSALCVSAVAWAQQTASEAADRALQFIEGNDNRSAIAVVAAAARKHPEDRKLGALLFSPLRDRRWPVAQTLPVKLPAAITFLKFSPDASLVVAGADDGTVRVLDTVTGNFLPGQMKHPGAVLGAAILPGNEEAISLDKTGVARTWKINDGALVKEWSNQGNQLTAFALSADTRRGALGYANGEAIVYNRETGEQIGERVKHGAAVTGLAFSRDGSFLASGCADGTARIWESATGRPSDFVIKHKAKIVSVDISRLTSLVLTASEDGIATITEARTGKTVLSDADCGSPILEAKFSPSGVRFRTVLADHTVRIWEIESGHQVEGVIRTNEGITMADWDPSGIRLVTGSEGTTPHLWRVRDGMALDEGMVHDSPARIVAFGPDGRLIATGCIDGTLRIWRQDLGASSAPIPTVRKHHGPVHSAFYSFDGDGLISASDDNTVMLWDLKSTKPLGTALVHSADAACAVYNPDHSRVVSICVDGAVTVFDAKDDHKKLATLKLDAPGRWVDFHREGKNFVTVAGSKAAIWSIDSLTKPEATIEHPGKSKLRKARYSPDGTLLATAGDDGKVCIWKTADRSHVTTLAKHEGPVLSVRFSFDGTLLVTGGEDGTIHVWDAKTWQATGMPMILPGEVYSALISPGKSAVVATSANSGGIRYFDISTGREFPVGIDLPADALCIEIHPSGDRLVTASIDGTIRSYGSPFVSEDIPSWMPDFAERIVGLRVDETGKFVPVHSTYDQLLKFPPPEAPARADFTLLARWMMTGGPDRFGMPRTTTTIRTIILQRAAERSLDRLYECYEAVPSDPLVLAALSLLIPSRPQGEFLAEFALARGGNDPLAQAYVASTFAKYGRLEEAERIMKGALVAAPNDMVVLRRAAKLDARQNRKEDSIAKFEKSVAQSPDDLETRRGFGWALYNLSEPAKALEQFKKADDLCGGADEDIVAGVCLAHSATGDEKAAVSRYKRLILEEAVWADATHLKTLAGWTEKELTELERLRQLANATR